jgi:hypothetical protein
MAVAAGSILADILMGMIQPLVEGADSRPAASPRIGAAGRGAGGIPAQVTRIQDEVNGGEGRITLRVPTPNTAGAIARQQLGNLGLDNGDIGYRGVRLPAVKDGDNYKVNVNGSTRTITGEALMNARGTELANLLGVANFAELLQNNNAGNNNPSTPVAPTNAQPQAAVGAQNAPASAGAEAAANSVSPAAGTTQPLPLAFIPQLSAAAPQAQQMPVPGMAIAPQMGPMMQLLPPSYGIPIPGYSAAPQQFPIAGTGKQKKGTGSAQLPGFGVVDMFNGGTTQIDGQ